MEDILFITQEIENRMRVFCSEELIKHVFDDFSKHAVIKLRKETKKPSKVWNITNYIHDDTINIINKMNVVLSFIQCGGIVQFNGHDYFDTSNPLAVIKACGLIDEEQLGILNDPWFYYNLDNSRTPNFKLLK